MAKAKQPEPLLRTPEDQMGGVEQFKLESKGAVGNLHADLRDVSMDDVVEATEQIAKSHGIYLEYNRATTGKEKDWMYMIRISVPGGGGFDLRQWKVIDEVANKYTTNPDGATSIRLTTRQNIQFHWVKKKDIINLVQDVAHSGYFTLNGCGDNARNVMGCPLSKFSNVFDANALAHAFGTYFRLPAEAHIQIFEIDTSLISTPEKHFTYGPRLLNRKFKIGIGAVHQNEAGEWYNDNCVEMRTNDVGIAPIIENGKVDHMMMYIGGGQGEKLGKPTMACLGKPLGVVHKDEVLKATEAIMLTHQEWGDRKNRHWARLKYVVQAQGVAWWQQQIKAAGVNLADPIENFYPGERCMHHGWAHQPSNGLWSYGAYIESGRLMDGHENGDLKSMVSGALEAFDGVEALITPNQDLVFANIPAEAREDFVAKLESYGHGKRNGKVYSRLRVLSGACVGLPTCRLATADSERYEPKLIDQLEELGYGSTCESIGITGCERQCFRPATKTIGLIGQGPGRYSIKLGGSEDGSTQGQYVSDGEKWYLAQVTDDVMPQVIGLLIDHYKANRKDEAEGMGAFHHRIGMNAIIDMLKANELTAELMEKTRPAPYAPDEAADVLH
jgi:sulfite reductase (NADPH) hemoprotein beta-component